jgi:hypothetical protein
MKLKLFLILLIVVPVPFSCEDKNECLDLYVDPYYDIQNISFIEVNTYSYTKGNLLNIESTDQDYDNRVYACDSLALYFMAEDLVFHSQYILKAKFGLTQDAFACNSRRPGYAGTRELIDKIYISSNYDFDETHNKNDNLSDIVDIFAYTTAGANKLMRLSDFNEISPYEAPKRFYLLLKRKPTKSMVQQFVIKYYMLSETGEANEYYITTTPVFHVR